MAEILQVKTNFSMTYRNSFNDDFSVVKCIYAQEKVVQSRSYKANELMSKTIIRFAFCKNWKSSH